MRLSRSLLAFAGFLVGLHPFLVVALHLAAVHELVRSFAGERIARAELLAVPISDAFKDQRVPIPAGAGLIAITTEAVRAKLHAILLTGGIAPIDADAVWRHV